jgi:predicted nucleic acid-binding protein
MHAVNKHGCPPSRSSSICAQVMIEYWVVATRPSGVNGLGLTPIAADADLEDLLNVLPCLPEPPAIGLRWRQLVRNYGVSGREAHDTRLVAIAIESGVREILTLNSADFARYREVTCITPAELLLR